MPKWILWAGKSSPEFFLSLLSTTGHIGELFADGHMLCRLLMKTPQATFGEAHCTGRRLYWKLKQQRLLKSASGMIRQSWQLVILSTTRALPLFLHIFLCICAFASQSYCAIFLFAYIMPWSKVMHFMENILLEGGSLKTNTTSCFLMMCHLCVLLIYEKKSCVAILRLSCDFQTHCATVVTLWPSNSSKARWP